MLSPGEGELMKTWRSEDRYRLYVAVPELEAWREAAAHAFAMAHADVLAKRQDALGVLYARAPKDRAGRTAAFAA